MGARVSAPLKQWGRRRARLQPCHLAILSLMKFPELAYITWAKSLPQVAINLARSGIDPCPASLLRLKPSDLVVTLPVKYGYAPLRDAIAARYGVAAARVFPLS